MAKRDHADRRQALKLIAGAGLVPIFGCGSGSSSSTMTGTAPTLPEKDAGVTTPSGICAPPIPEETAGPFAADGSNGPNAMTLGIVRSDIRTSFGTMKGTAEGVPLAMRLTLVDTNAGCAPLPGYAFYVWHCNRDGKYSLYELTDQNYLRGVQGTDAMGTASFTSIFPGCYSGRWPHIHFEIYPSIAAATAYTNKVKTSQLALPADACNAVYATNSYGESAARFAQTSLTKDTVFRDGSAKQLATVLGTVTDGYLATLTIGIAGVDDLIACDRRLRPRCDRRRSCRT